MKSHSYLTRINDEQWSDLQRIKRLDILRKILSNGLEGINMRTDADELDPNSSFRR